MKKLLLLLCALLSCLGCAKQQPADPTTHRSQSDEALEEIRLQAQETFLIFIDKVQNPGPGEQDFMVKHPFETDMGSGFNYEHLWLGNIRIENGNYYGTVYNTPYYISGLNFGDRVSFEAETVSDWMYFKKGKIIGGHSSKYLMEQTDWEPEVHRYYELFE